MWRMVDSFFFCFSSFFIGERMYRGKIQDIARNQHKYLPKTRSYLKFTVFVYF